MASFGRFTYDQIYSYINDGVYPGDFAKTDKQALRKRAKFFLVRHSNLYYIGGQGKVLRMVIESSKKKRRIISSIHGSNHLGVQRTNDLVSKKYYWPGLYKDIVEYVGTCDKCQRNNKTLKKPAGSLHPIPVTSKLWCQVGMDLIGPLPETSRGNKYIVTLTDYFSKWAEAAPLPNKSADGIAVFMYSTMCRFGCPEVVITDQGREFVNELSSKLYRKTNTKHRITSAYHPQTNGLTERFNQTLTRCLAKLSCEDHSNWDTLIDTALMGYRASFQSSIKHSPYFMLFQKEMRLPIDIEMLPNIQEMGNQSSEDVESTIQALLGKRKEVFEKAARNIKHAQRKQKENYDRKNLQKELSVDTEVMVENTAQKERKGGKFKELFRGTYSIAEALGKGLYRLRNKQGIILRKKFNIKRLKVYKRRLPKLNIKLKPSDIFQYCSSDDDCEELPSLSHKSSLPSYMNSTSLDPPPMKRNSDSILNNSQLERFAHEMQELSSEALVSKVSQFIPIVNDIKDGKVPECPSYDAFIAKACGNLRKLQGISNAISCISDSQFKSVADFLISTCKEKGTPKLLSYTLDVLLPELLLRVVIEMFNTTRKEASIIMFTKFITNQHGSTDDECDDQCDDLNWELLEYVKKKHECKGEISTAQAPPKPMSSNTLAQKLMIHSREVQFKATATQRKQKPVIIADSTPQKQHVSRKQCPWIPELKLDHSDKETLLSSTGWLNGNIINGAQELLKKQFPHLSGLQDVELGLVVNFQIPGCEFVQILHSAPNHWVTVSTIGVEDQGGVILLFDSKYTTVSASVKSQVAALLCTAGDKIIMNVQNQLGSEQ